MNNAQKCKGKENASSNKNASHHFDHNRLRQLERKRQETVEERSERLKKAREHMRNKRRRVLEPTEQENITNITDTEMLPENELCIQQLTNSDCKLLKKFRNEMNKCVHRYFPTCKERFPSITLVKRECRRCYTEKGEIKKFSFANNMDSGVLPEELTGLTEIEEMLIAQIFPVVSVYYLHGGQYAYRGNVISFPQDVNEFVT
ncbi:18196_t:CDS:1 [Gigaspora margarita]|uniref:18196_t:CDS:1 n=1 Tax=Gigaspora margarita TaxID=4874 RepID=A0ABN7VFB4_GIGMA|nr:18196_t:CDS:1 [Gigaspora margarita]